MPAQTAIRGSDDVITASPYASALRVNPPLRTPADALACLGALADGTVDAIATDHAPHTEVDKAVEFGLAANGISGIETALGLVLAAVDAGQLTLGRAIAALTVGPAAVLGQRLAGWSRARPPISWSSIARSAGRLRRTRSNRRARTRRCSGWTCLAGCC